MVAAAHLNKFSPCLDEQKHTQFKEQISHAETSYDMKHPLSISAKHSTKSNVLEDTHEINF